MSLPRFLADEDPRGTVIRAVRRMKPSVEFTTVVEQGLSSAAECLVLIWSASEFEEWRRRNVYLPF
jgi:hypothetical protein